MSELTKNDLKIGRFTQLNDRNVSVFSAYLMTERLFG